MDSIYIMYLSKYDRLGMDHLTLGCNVEPAFFSGISLARLFCFARCAARLFIWLLTWGQMGHYLEPDYFFFHGTASLFSSSIFGARILFKKIGTYP